MEFLKKEALSIIGNIPLLSKFFIAFLFFELYFSISGLSLWQFDFEFEKINFAPFLYFLFFITFMLIPWFVINFIKDIIRVRINGEAKNIVKWKNSFKSFLLMCLSIYFIIFPSYPNEQNNFIKATYLIVLFLIALLSIVYFITSDTNHYDDKSDNVIKVNLVKEEKTSLNRSFVNRS